MCDTLVSLTDDGVIFAKNSDRDPNESQLLEWHPAEDHPEPATSVTCTWITVPQHHHTNAVLLSRPWWMWGAEMGANDAGVVIGNEAVFTRDRSETEPGLLGMDLLRLALERTTSAHDAVGCIVELLERHGQGGSCSVEHPRFNYDNSFIVADPDGAIVLETAGRSHATEVVRGRGRSISNGLTIEGFAAAHTDRLRSRVARCADRRARTEASARSAGSALDMFAALRDHGPPKGLDHRIDAGPRYSVLNGALAAPCAHAGGLVTSTQSTASWVADLRGEPQHWATATSAPCTSLFKPVSVDRPVDTGAAPTGSFDDHSIWWRHERLHRAVMVNPGALLSRYAPDRDALEADWVADPPDPATAFELAARAEQRWLGIVSDAIAAGAAPDERPAFVRRLWRRWDAAAAMPALTRAAPSAVHAN